MKVAAALLYCACSSALAESVDTLAVGHLDRRYHIELQARLDAPVDDSYAVFRDFRNLPTINRAVELAESLPSPVAGSERWRTQVRFCIAFFCARLKQVQDLHSARSGDAYRLDATVIPALSDLRYGVATWTLASCGSQTCLGFRAEIEPDFWVPPLLGPSIIERTLRRQAHATAAGIERLALARMATARGTPP